MTSQITQKTYDEFINSAIIIKDLTPFYISGKSGTVRLEKISNRDYNNFTWFRNHTSRYVEYCVAFKEKHNHIFFKFCSFEDLSENINKQDVCLRHSRCQGSCSAYLITSPIEKCAICLKDMQMHMLEETECEHRFCLECLDTYVNSKLTYTEDEDENVIDGGIPCPVCRRDIQLCNDCNYSMFKCICK
jgi:hypothetical protein